MYKSRTSLTMLMVSAFISAAHAQHSFKPVPPGWVASGIARDFGTDGKVSDFTENFDKLNLEHVEAWTVTQNGQTFLKVKLTGQNARCQLATGQKWADRASLWADVTDGVNEVRVKLREYSHRWSGNEALPRIVPAPKDPPQPIPQNPLAMRLVFHGGCPPH